MAEDKSIAGKKSYLTFATGRWTPHALVFLGLNCLYFLPVLIVFFFNYSVDEKVTLADLDTSTVIKTSLVYFVGVLSFLLGSKDGSGYNGLDGIKNVRVFRLFELSPAFWVVSIAIAVCFLASKVLLIPLGVYSEYAFDTENMGSSVWSFSMFCSESILLLSILALFSRSRHNVRWFLVFSLLNAIDLLHGTRIFFMIAGLAFCFYGFVRRKLNWRLLLAIGVGVVAVGYAVFLTRSNALVDTGSFSFVRLISPIMFESIFSQLALFELARNPHVWNALGSPVNLVLDAVYFSAPRFMLPGKDQMLFLDRFNDLSPLGAFSGYAQGLIYLGFLFPLFYFVLGRIASWLFRQTRSSSLWTIAYVYFICDFLFRIMRDGYIIPIKMLIDGLIILATIKLFSPGTSPSDSIASRKSTNPGFIPSQGIAHE